MDNHKAIEGTKDTETLILEAAEREFMTKGFAGARTTAIAESAGVTHAMLHYYFRTKEKLFDRIISNKVALLKEALLGSVIDTDQSLDVMIRNIIDRHLDFINANPDMPKFIIGELLSGSKRAELLLNNIKTHAPVMIAILQSKINEGVAKGEFREVDAGMLVLDIASLNIFSFVATPLVTAVIPEITTDPESFLAKRKRENYETIIRKLRKNK